MERARRRPVVVDDLEMLVKIEAEARKVLKLCAHVRTLYRWGHADTMGSTRSATFEVGSRGGHSDPTGVAATPRGSDNSDRDRRRSALNQAKRKVEIAADRLGDARNTLEKVFGGMFAQATKPPSDALVVKTELASSISAKATRESRGEGWGQG
ncbi:MAG: hypothetical protein WEA10_06800 [Actinomycetota bacterium]